MALTHYYVKYLCKIFIQRFCITCINSQFINVSETLVINAGLSKFLLLVKCQIFINTKI